MRIRSGQSPILTSVSIIAISVVSAIGTGCDQPPDDRAGNNVPVDTGALTHATNSARLKEASSRLSSAGWLVSPIFEATTSRVSAPMADAPDDTDAKDVTWTVVRIPVQHQVLSRAGHLMLGWTEGGQDFIEVEGIEEESDRLLAAALTEVQVPSGGVSDGEPELLEAKAPSCVRIVGHSWDWVRGVNRYFVQNNCSEWHIVSVNLGGAWPNTKCFIAYHQGTVTWVDKRAPWKIRWTGIDLC